MEDSKIEVEGSPNSSYIASDEEGTQEAYADDLLADEEWLESYERDRKEEEALEKTLQKRLSVEKHSQSTKKPKLILTGGLTDAEKYLAFRLLRLLSGLSAALSLETQ